MVIPTVGGSDDDRRFTSAAIESFTLFTIKLVSEGFSFSSSSVVDSVGDVAGRFTLKLGPLLMREGGIDPDALILLSSEIDR